MAALGSRERLRRSATIDAALTAWAAPPEPRCGRRRLLRAGIPAAALARTGDLVQEPASGRARILGRHRRGVCRACRGAPASAARRARAGTGRGYRSGAADVLGCRRNVSPSCGRTARPVRPFCPRVRLQGASTRRSRSRHGVGTPRALSAQNSPLRYASSSRLASSSDGSGPGSPRLRSVPVKFGGRFSLNACRPSSPSVVVWISRS